MFGLNMMLTAPDGGVHADADVMHWMADSGFRDLRVRAAAAADAAPCRDRGQAVNRAAWPAGSCRCIGCRYAAPLTCAQTPAPSSAVGELKSLGQDRYQIGRIVVDKRARTFTVPGRVHVLGKPLEYLATSPGGMKAYETLLELDATGSEFNLACILIGLERDPKQAALATAQPSGAPRRTAGRPLYRLVRGRQAAQAIGRRGAAQSGGRRAKAESVEWVYLGSPASIEGRPLRGRSSRER